MWIQESVWFYGDRWMALGSEAIFRYVWITEADPKGLPSLGTQHIYTGANTS